MQRMSEKLNWAHRIDAGVVLCKDGSMIAGWDMIGIDPEGAEETVLEAHAQQMARAMMTGVEGITFWTIFARKNYRGEQAKFLDSERLPPAVNYLEHEQHLLLTAPGVAFENSIKLFMSWHPAKHDKNIERDLQDFKQHCDTLEARLGHVVDLTRLKTVTHHQHEGSSFQQDALVSALSELTHGAPMKLRQSDATRGMYLDSLLAPEYRQCSFLSEAYINDRPVSLISIVGYPQEYETAAVGVLEQLGFEYHWVSRFTPLNQAQTDAAIDTQKRNWKRAQGGDKKSSHGA